MAPGAQDPEDYAKFPVTVACDLCTSDEAEQADELYMLNVSVPVGFDPPDIVTEAEVVCPKVIVDGLEVSARAGVGRTSNA